MGDRSAITRSMSKSGWVKALVILSVIIGLNEPVSVLTWSFGHDVRPAVSCCKTRALAAKARRFLPTFSSMASCCSYAVDQVYGSCLTVSLVRSKGLRQPQLNTDRCLCRSRRSRKRCEVQHTFVETVDNEYCGPVADAFTFPLFWSDISI